MQTFLPYPDFRKTFEVLDWKRLGKQRVEALQIIRAIAGIPKEDGQPYKGWLNHPCTIMWNDYLDALKLYYNLCLEEWMRRGYNNNLEQFDVYEQDLRMPDWLGFEPFHSSHRAILLWKDYEYYSKFQWKEKPNNTYVWQDKEKKWYYYLKNEKNRLYFKELEENND